MNPKPKRRFTFALKGTLTGYGDTLEAAMEDVHELVRAELTDDYDLTLVCEEPNEEEE